MGITVSTWSGTYSTQAIIGLSHPNNAPIDESPSPIPMPPPAAEVTYGEYNPPTGGVKLCYVKHVSGATHHLVDLEITGPTPEAIRTFLLEMLAALPVGERPLVGFNQDDGGVPTLVTTGQGL